MKREQLRGKFSALLMNTSEEKPLKCNIPFGDSYGLSTLQLEDGMFYLVLITSNDWLNPQYSYPLTDKMLVGHTFAKQSYVKCQLIAGYIERDVVRRLGSIKEQYFNEIVDKIIESIF